MLPSERRIGKEAMMRLRTAQSTRGRPARSQSERASLISHFGSLLTLSRAGGARRERGAHRVPVVGGALQLPRAVELGVLRVVEPADLGGAGPAQPDVGLANNLGHLVAILAGEPEVLEGGFVPEGADRLRAPPRAFRLPPGDGYGRSSLDGYLSPLRLTAREPVRRLVSARALGLLQAVHLLVPGLRPRWAEIGASSAARGASSRFGRLDGAGAAGRSEGGAGSLACPVDTLSRAGPGCELTLR